jgi:hypothetical protein
MSGQSGISPVDQILRSVDLAGIQDERARECIRLLLNLIESLTVDLRKAQAENLYLREQLNRRQGGGGKPDQPKDTAGAKSQSSEKERAETKQRTRRGKLERVRIDREEVWPSMKPSLRTCPATGTSSAVTFTRGLPALAITKGSPLAARSTSRER